MTTTTNTNAGIAVARQAVAAAGTWAMVRLGRVYAVGERVVRRVLDGRQLWRGVAAVAVIALSAVVSLACMVWAPDQTAYAHDVLGWPQFFAGLLPLMVQALVWWPACRVGRRCNW